MGTRSDGDGFWWDQSAIKFMLPQVMKHETGDVQFTTGTCTVVHVQFS